MQVAWAPRGLGALLGLRAYLVICVIDVWVPVLGQRDA